MKNIICLWLILCAAVPAFAQLSKPAPFIEKKTQEAQLVFEGKIVAVSAFVDTIYGVVKNTNYVLVSKRFKGDFISDTVKILTIGAPRGSRIDDAGPVLAQGLEGVFFCTLMKPELVKYIGSNVYRLIGGDGFISLGTYRPGSQRTDYNRKIDYGKEIEKVERTVYDSIELFTGQKYVKLRPNGLEERGGIEK
jgi:hypothetical protein